ncbi:MAG: beta-ketoacyl synthase chain length factor [Acidobacteria bacterium]|nr:beta-ketoacyl synthase chain length factor [Acidobacteriota bacterium]
MKIRAGDRPAAGAGSHRRVVVTGAGVVSPLGDSPAALHRALAAGTSARKPIELFETSGIGCHEAGEIRPFDPQAYVGERNLRPLDRTSRLLVVAAQLALADAGWAPGTLRRPAPATDAPGSAASSPPGEAAATDAPPAAEVGLVVGTTFCSVRTIAEFDRRALRLGPSHASPLDFANSVINAAAGQAAIWHGLRGVNSTLGGGEASGLQAIAQAAELLRAGRAEAVLAGGAEELCFESFFGYYRARRLCGSRQPGAGTEEWPVPFEARRNGFSLAEGAALLLLEEAAAAAARGASVHAEVLGWGAAFAAAAGEEGLQDAVARAVKLALGDAAASPAEIGCLSASASGSSEVDRAEALGVAAALGERAASLPVTAIKAMLGEGLGVSAAWQAVDLVETMRDGELPGIAGLERLEPGLPLGGASAATRRLAPAARRQALITAVSADGHCAALVLGAPPETVQ